MKIFAQIKDGLLHYKFLAESKPELSPEILLMDITHVIPAPQEGWILNGDFFVPPAPPTNEQLTAIALKRRDQLLTQATLAIAPFQDAVDLIDATPAETAALKKWKQYRVAINRVSDQDGWPRDILWPVAPDT